LQPRPILPSISWTNDDELDTFLKYNYKKLRPKLDSIYLNLVSKFSKKSQ